MQSSKGWLEKSLGFQRRSYARLLKTPTFRQVRKYIAIFFLSGYLLSTNAELLELTKLPLLAEHFREHKKWDQKISIVEFLYIHYFKDDNKYGDQARDKQMPFKTSHYSPGVLSVVILSSPDFTIVSRAVFEQNHDQRLRDSSPYCSQYLSSIWQPPKA